MQCWGYGVHGQLGQEDALSRGGIAGSMGDALFPVDLGMGRTAQKAVAGEGFTCVLLDNSEVVCFGRNASGQLGIGTSKDVGKEAGEMGDELVSVNFGSDFRYAVDISSGPCALLDNGAVKVSGKLGSTSTIRFLYCTVLFACLLRRRIISEPAQERDRDSYILSGSGSLKPILCTPTLAAT